MGHWSNHRPSYFPPPFLSFGPHWTLSCCGYVSWVFNYSPNWVVISIVLAIYLFVFDVSFLWILTHLVMWTFLWFMYACGLSESQWYKMNPSSNLWISGFIYLFCFCFFEWLNPDPFTAQAERIWRYMVISQFAIYENSAHQTILARDFHGLIVEKAHKPKINAYRPISQDPRHLTHGTKKLAQAQDGRPTTWGPRPMPIAVIYTFLFDNEERRLKGIFWSCAHMYDGFIQYIWIYTIHMDLHKWN